MIGLAMVLVAMGAGCGDDEPGSRPSDGGARFDSGAHDAGSSDDASTPSDGSTTDADGRIDASPTPPDAGACGRDAGAVGGDCVLYVPVGSFGPLTAACLPRCSSATGAAYRACTTQSCRNAAVAGDTTPGTSYYIGSARVNTPMDCGGCVAYQEMHCFSLVCESQVDAYVDECIAGGSASSCDFALASLDACLAALSPAEEATVAACYESPDGPAGCFPCD
ncbi:hypothetical protein DB32_006356 [Sandaracinus amylolyticus]|uniref:Uncharacterized protein n=1 Tax=Sandaracinus amylolyticus TaxID=927083 RepID=A0A0F6YMF2_9BACT|nr:hypothetical protein DB32_006356 [Sandaracinus amylolyticus]